LPHDDVEKSGRGSERFRAVATARFVPPAELDLQGFRAGDFWLGRTESRQEFGWHEDLNLLTCAGPRAGKGVGSVIPNLLTFPGSAIVVDPKLENAAATAQYRADVLGQKVLVIGPSSAMQNVPERFHGTYNPLDLLDEADGPIAVTNAQTVADGLVIRSAGDGKDRFFDDNAHDYMRSGLLYMLRHYRAEDRTLMKLAETVAVGDLALFKEYVAYRQQKDPDFKASRKEGFELFLDQMIAMEEFGGIVSQTGAKIQIMGAETQGNVMSSAATHLDFLRGGQELWPSLQSNIDATKTFRLSEFRRQDRHITVYLGLPVHMMQNQSRWLRIILLQVMKYMQTTPFKKERDRPVMMMIDEFAQLGPLPQILNALTYGPGFGLRLWLIVQDLNQLKANYPDSWETIMNACGIKQFFGIGDLFTAKYVSEYAGDEMIEVPSISVTETQSQTEGRTSSHTTNESRGRTSGTTDSEGTSSTIGQSFSKGESETKTENQSSSEGVSEGRGSSEGNSFTEGNNTGTSSNYTVGTGQNQSGGRSDAFRERWLLGVWRFVEDLSTTDSSGWGQSRNDSWANGTSAGRSSSRGSNIGTNESTGTSKQTSSGNSNAVGTSTTEGRSSSTGTNRSRSKSESESTTHGTGETVGESASTATGRNYALSVSVQPRRLYRAEEMMTAFTKSNLMQLVLIRDHNPMLLVRTPYYLDPLMRDLLAILDVKREG
jgi:type IV secretory pathway TraG/TraD family ATPase VirD4